MHHPSDGMGSGHRGLSRAEAGALATVQNAGMLRQAPSTVTNAARFVRGCRAIGNSTAMCALTQLLQQPIDYWRKEGEIISQYPDNYSK